VPDASDGDAEASLMNMYVLAAFVVAGVVAYMRLKKRQRHAAPVSGLSSGVAGTKYNQVPVAAPEDSGTWDDGWGDKDDDDEDGWEESGGRCVALRFATAVPFLFSGVGFG
jgi:ribosome modulation factor